MTSNCMGLTELKDRIIYWYYQISFNLAEASETIHCRFDCETAFQNTKEKKEEKTVNNLASRPFPNQNVSKSI